MPMKLLLFIFVLHTLGSNWVHSKRVFLGVRQWPKRTSPCSSLSFAPCGVVWEPCGIRDWYNELLQALGTDLSGPNVSVHVYLLFLCAVRCNQCAEV
jgi:hypothetical protein